MEMKWIAVLFVGMCFAFAISGSVDSYTKSSVEQQKEKTKQLELQWKIDSTKAANSPYKRTN